MRAIERNNRLYNVIFPIWLLWLLPVVWLIVLPANFLVDALVLWLGMKGLRLAQPREVIKRSILRVWLFGFLSDLTGSAMLYAAVAVELPGSVGRWWYENMTNAITLNPFENVFAFLFVSVCVAVAGVLIYLFNAKFAFKKTDLAEVQRKKLARLLAFATAPYLYLLPTIWFYR